MFNLTSNENIKKAMASMFQPISNVSWDLQSGKTGIKTDGGLITLGSDGILEQNPMDFFSMELPAFAMLTPATEVKAGDILVSDKKAYAFILETGLKGSTDESEEDVGKSSIRTMNLQGHVSRFRPKRVSMMGINNGLTIVRSFQNLFGTSENTGGSMDLQSMLPLMLMSGDKKDMSDLLPLMMLSGGMKDMNPLILMMLMGDKSPFG